MRLYDQRDPLTTIHGRRRLFPFWGSVDAAELASATPPAEGQPNPPGAGGGATPAPAPTVEHVPLAPALLGMAGIVPTPAPVQPAAPAATAPAPAAAAHSAPEPAPTLPAATAPAATPTDLQTAVQQATQAERIRVSQIRQRLSLLGMSETLIEQQIGAGASLEAALMAATDHLAQQNQPVPRRLQAQVQRTGAEQFAATMTEVALAKLHGGPATPAQQAAWNQAGQFRDKPLWMHAAHLLEQAGYQNVHDRQSVTDYIIKAPRSGWENGIHAPGADAGPYNTPGSFPNLMNAIMNRVVSNPLPLANYTYRRWTYPMAPAVDYRPSTSIRTGLMRMLDAWPDGQPLKSQQTTNEEAAMIFLERKGAKWSLTPRMMQDDDLGELARQVNKLVDACERTRNYNALQLLAGNLAVYDDIALFHSTHGNIAATAGGPTQSILSGMRLLLGRQKDPNSQHNLGLEFNWLLYGLHWVETAMQNFAPLAMLQNVIVPTADSSNGTFPRGSLNLMHDAMLDSFDTGGDYLPWFAGANPLITESIKFRVMSGYDSGRMESWYDPETKNREHSIEDIYGYAVCNWRGLIENAGS